MAKVFRLVRDLTDEERSWLHNADARNLRAGDRVREYVGHTYGTIREPDVALCLTPGGPFFGLPRDAVEDVTDYA